MEKARRRRNFLKNFACGELSPFMYFNFAQNFINYLCATVTNFVKNFASGELSPFLYFNFVQNFIIYLCATVTSSVEKLACGLLPLAFGLSPAAGFRHSHISI